MLKRRIIERFETVRNKDEALGNNRFPNCKEIIQGFLGDDSLNLKLHVTEGNLFIGAKVFLADMIR
ncbi:hypothetical protein [Paenibacillus terrae]|uniref:Uncharacterized protein n=1 Tax=Paenibacillus terrae TaxID=159743 RepID=A0A0D7WZ36_9BACL|nr:hypothetical protein [Paenibacillus terrae]KJD43017.1 hypothetical protein QD47_24965 [Paenibacillus terrae]